MRAPRGPARSCPGRGRTRRSRRPPSRPGDGRDRRPGTAAGRRRRGSGWCRRAGWGCRRSSGSRPGRRARIVAASSGSRRRFESLEVAGQVGPGQPGRQELAGLALGLAQVEPGREPVGPLGILLEVGLEVLDGPGELPACLAGPAHREEEPGAERGALGQVAGLVEQVLGPVGVGRDRPGRRARAGAGRRRGRPRPAGPCGRRPGAGWPRRGPAPRRPPGCPRPARRPPARSGSWRPRVPAGSSAEGGDGASPGPRPSAPPAARRWPGDSPGRLDRSRSLASPRKAAQRGPRDVILPFLERGDDLGRV